MSSEFNPQKQNVMRCVKNFLSICAMLAIAMFNQANAQVTLLNIDSDPNVDFIEFPSIATDDDVSMRVVVENRRPVVMSYMVFDDFAMLHTGNEGKDCLLMNVNHLPELGKDGKPLRISYVELFRRNGDVKTILASSKF